MSDEPVARVKVVPHEDLRWEHEVLFEHVRKNGDVLRVQLARSAENVLRLELVRTTARNGMGATILVYGHEVEALQRATVRFHDELRALKVGAKREQARKPGEAPATFVKVQSSGHIGSMKGGSK